MPSIIVHSLPSTMRAVEVRAYDGSLQSLALAERPVPRPEANQVLVRMVAAPINPSDLAFLNDQHGVHKPLPAIPGYVGGGIVVASGRNPMARMLVGQRVACGVDSPESGTWAEYTLASIATCIPLRADISTIHGSLLGLNPMTAWGLLDMARRGRHQTIIQTAAASEVGRWVVRLGRHFQITTVHIVRREAQVAQLRAAGAEHVLNSSVPDFDAQLRACCQRLKVTMAFDAVGGSMMDSLLQALPSRTHLLLYGLLSLEPCSVPPQRLIFDGLRVEGFYVLDWLMRLNYLQRVVMINTIQRLAREVPPTVRACFPLEAAASAVDLYQREMGSGKILIMPDLRRVSSIT